MNNDFSYESGSGENAGKRNALRTSIVIVAIVAAAALLRFLPGYIGIGGSAPWSKDFDGNVRGAEIGCLSCEVKVLPSEDGSCRAEYSGSRSCVCTAEVKNGTLTVREKKRLPRFFAVIGSGDTKLTVYLPEEVETLSVSAVSGDLLIGDGLGAEETVLETVSGDVNAGGLRGGSLTVTTVSGEVEMSGITAEGDAGFESVSGDISLSGFTAGDMTVETISGDVSAEDADAAALDISTVSGDVSLALRSAMDYAVSTVSGDVNVPAADKNGGNCQISTTSGDIWISHGADT